MTIVLEALPTALNCQLVYLALPGATPPRRAMFRGSRMPDADLDDLVAALLAEPDQEGARVLPGDGRFWCLEASVPIGAAPGQLVAGRSSPLDPRTDRVLVRSAANLVGTTLETARVLENAHRKDEFLAMLGHELRNPLAPILTAVELLSRHPSVAREQGVIERHTRHLARLVDDLLDISRVTSGHIELRDEQVSLDSVLSQAAELVAPAITRHRHTLRVASGFGVTLRGDAVRLAQVFGNLLANAAKFTPPGGEIDVSVERTANAVRVAVKDNGRGIARDQLERIFEPFVQAEGPRDALRGGLGLGLAIVRNLVERHRGTIQAQSDGKGHGSAFVVELPTIERAEEREEPAPPRSTSLHSGVRVLVVDDNVDVAQLLCEALRVEGFETDVAHDARTALEKWRAFAPHAAVLDVGLPDLDGYELAKALRDEHGAAPALVAATGYGQGRDRERALSAGFDWHLVKPVSVRDLVRVLDERRAAGEAKRDSPTE
ncbi:MAG TPA: hybrid sensor histidine kinase/response regulator [Polyangiaceae bacterium]|nr:hybrid sensor histidine kinase/response regulator [Polyangiaceae bacterium]